MTLKELKEWTNSLPEEFSDFRIINAEGGDIDGEFKYRIDKPITFALIDEQTKEIVMGNDIQTVPHSIPTKGDVQKLIDGEA